jgi:hypothetical protein
MITDRKIFLLILSKNFLESFHSSSPFLCWILFSNILAGYYTILGLVMDDKAGKYLDNLGFLLLRASPPQEGKPGSQKPKIPPGRSNIAPVTAAASSGSSQLERETGVSLVCWGDVALD